MYVVNFSFCSYFRKKRALQISRKTDRYDGPIERRMIDEPIDGLAEGLSNRHI